VISAERGRGDDWRDFGPRRTQSVEPCITAIRKARPSGCEPILFVGQAALPASPINATKSTPGNSGRERDVFPLDNFLDVAFTIPARIFENGLLSFEKDSPENQAETSGRSRLPPLLRISPSNFFITENETPWHVQPARNPIKPSFRHPSCIEKPARCTRALDRRQYSTGPCTSGGPPPPPRPSELLRPGVMEKQKDQTLLRTRVNANSVVI